MNENILTIKYAHGTMKIVLDRFFPCSVDILKKLYKKVIYTAWDDQIEITDKLKVYFQEMILICQGNYEHYAADHSRMEAQIAATTQEIVMQKDVSGKSLSKDDIKKRRDMRKYYHEMSMECQRLAKKALSDKGKFERGLEYIETIRWW